MGKLIAGDAGRYHEPYLLGKQERLLRYCYYSGIPGRPLDFGNDDACDIPVLCSDLAAYRQLPGAYYVMLELPPPGVGRTAEALVRERSCRAQQNTS